MCATRGGEGLQGVLPFLVNVVIPVAVPQRYSLLNPLLVFDRPHPRPSFVSTQRTMMASFMSFFGGRRDSKQAAREAIVAMRQQLQMIEKKEDFLQKKIEEELKKAKANAVSNKAGTPSPIPRLRSLKSLASTQLRPRRYAERSRVKRRWTN